MNGFRGQGYNPKIKTIYWRILERKPFAFVIEYWTKADKSNALRGTLVSLSEPTLLKFIESETGLKRFKLEQIK